MKILHDPFIICDHYSDSLLTFVQFERGGYSVNSLRSRPEGNLALAVMQEGGQETARKPKSSDGTYTLTTIIDGNYVPLIFDLTNGEVVSLNAGNAIAFDHYLICNLKGIIRYENDVNEDNISEYVDGNDITCNYTETWFNGAILTDLETGQVVDITKLQVLPDYDDYYWNCRIGFNADYILLPSDNRVVRISKDNLNHAEYITSDLEGVGINFVLGDYIIDDYDHAYLIDNSAAPIDIDSTVFGSPGAMPYLMPSDPNAKHVYIISGDYVCKISTAKGTFGNELAREKLDLPSSGFIYSIDIPNALKPYTQTVEHDGYYRQNYGEPWVNSDYDLMGNVRLADNGYYYFEETDTELGVKLVKKETAGDYSCLNEVKILDYEPNGNNGQRRAILYQKGKDIYFLDKNNHLRHLDIQTGICERSSYTANIRFVSEKYLTISGTQVLYKEMVTGSDYQTMAFNVEDLQTPPHVVGYETSDIINLPDFSI